MPDPVPEQAWTWDETRYSESGARVGDGGVVWFSRDAGGPHGWERRQSYEEFLTRGPSTAVPDHICQRVVEFLRPYFPDLAPAPLDADRCEVCGDLTRAMSIRVGRGDRFPPATERLVSVGDGLRHCPACRAIFQFEQRPQYHGTGTADEEGYVRLEHAACRALGPLVFCDAAPRSGWGAAVEASLEHAGEALTLARLRRLEPAQDEALLPVLIGHYLRSNSSAMQAYFGDLMYLQPARAPRIAEAIEAQRASEIPSRVRMTLALAKRTHGRRRGRRRRQDRWS